MMVDELKLRLPAEDIPSLELFNNTWTKKFPELKIPKFNTLGACDTCTRIKNTQEAFSRRTGEWENLRKEQVAHLNQVRLERTAQMERDQTASSFPHVQWTITTDFMQDLYLPWIINKPKGW